jgi:hypothetical protein
MRRLSELTLTQSEAVVTAERLCGCFGRLAVMEASGIEEVLIMLRQQFAASIDNSQPSERLAYHHMIMMVPAFSDTEQKDRLEVASPTNQTD